MKYRICKGMQGNLHKYSKSPRYDYNDDVVSIDKNELQNEIDRGSFRKLLEKQNLSYYVRKYGNNEINSITLIDVEMNNVETDNHIVNIIVEVDVIGHLYDSFNRIMKILEVFCKEKTKKFEDFVLFTAFGILYNDDYSLEQDDIKVVMSISTFDVSYKDLDRQMEILELSESNKPIVTIENEVRINESIILEKGDKIKILKESDDFLDVIVYGGKHVYFSREEIEEMVDPDNQLMYQGADNLPKWLYVAINLDNVTSFGIEKARGSYAFKGIFDFLASLLTTNGAIINVRSDDRNSNGIVYK